jgi:hypothetical protein
MACAKAPRRGRSLPTDACPTITQFDFYFEVDLMGNVQ